MKSWFSKKDRLLAGTIMAGAAVAGFAGPAVAQDSGDEEIVVTGSRIPQPNLIAVSPVTAVDSEDIALRGVTRIEDMLNTLPQTFGAQGANLANASAGTATVDLRQLGAVRTLVLINGRRLVPGDPFTSAADLNAIPGALVDRVEVLTGGASAIYGADAVAGVVNFIMQDDLEGVRFNAQYSFYQHNQNDEPWSQFNINRANGGNPFNRIAEDNVVDGETWDTSVAFGASSEDGRGNVTMYASYRNVAQVLQGDRDFSACTLSSSTTGPDDVFFNCGGSTTTFPSRIQPVIQATGTGIGIFGGPANTQSCANPANFSTCNPAFGRHVDNSVNLPTPTPYPFPPPTPNPDPGAGVAPGPVTPFNFGPTNHFQRPDERYALGGFAHYEINPHVELYTELMFMDDRTVAQIAPGGVFRFAGLGTVAGANYVVNCDNAFLTQDQINFICNSDQVRDIIDNPGTANDEVADLVTSLTLGADDPTTPYDDTNPAAILAAVVTPTLGNQATCPDPIAATPLVNEAFCVVDIGHRNLNGDPRRSDLRHTMYRAVLGARGEITDGWNYDVYGLYGTTIYQQTGNNLSLSRVNRALINVGGQCGVNVDADPTNDDPGCVPLDLFDANGPTAAQLDYVTQDNFLRGETVEQVFSASVTGDLATIGVTSPWAEDGFGVAMGVEYRRESSVLVADTGYCPSTAPGTVTDILGGGGATCDTSGSYDVFELFGEVQAPIVQDQPFFHLLQVTAAYRYSDYSTGANTDTYKLGLEWAPTEDIRFRGAYQRAVRAPNIVELFSPAAVGLDGTLDPCDGVPSQTLAQCQNSGVTAAQYGAIANNPANQYNGLLGGNANLNPEVADTITVGFVFTPTFLEGFTASVDWYNIQVDGLIGIIGADLIVTQCGITGSAFFCGLVNRAPGTGQLWGSPLGFITDTNLNTGSAETTGVDVAMNYRRDIGSLGGIGLSLTGSWIQEWITEPLPGFPTYDCVGLYGTVCGRPLPEWRHVFSMTWDTPMDGLSLTGTWRHFGDVSLDTFDPSNPGFVTPGTPGSYESDRFHDAQNYFDIAGSWDAWENVTFRAGVNNILDRDPPINGQGTCPTGPCNGNTWPQIYDALGRYVFFGVTADF